MPTLRTSTESHCLEILQTWERSADWALSLNRDGDSREAMLRDPIMNKRENLNKGCLAEANRKQKSISNWILGKDETKCFPNRFWLVISFFVHSITPRWEFTFLTCYLSMWVQAFGRSKHKYSLKKCSLKTRYSELSQKGFKNKNLQ